MAIFATTIDQVISDLEAAVEEFDKTRIAAKDAIDAFETKRSMENSALVEGAMDNLGWAHDKLQNVLALLSADAKRFKAEVRITQRHVKRLGL